MAYIKCDGCGEIVEIPAELCPDPETIAITEPYYCDACEPRSGLTQVAADGGEESPDFQDFDDDDDRPLCTTCGENPAYANNTCWDCIEKGAL